MKGNTANTAKCAMCLLIQLAEDAAPPPGTPAEMLNLNPVMSKMRQTQAWGQLQYNYTVLLREERVMKESS